jgi:uracil-DNA glycosylase
MTKQQVFDTIVNDIAHCRKCDRLRNVTPYPMSYICYSNIFNKQMMIVGRNPGIENDHSKINEKVFLKKYHKLWWECKFGLYLRKCFSDNIIINMMFFTNICKCSSPGNSKLLDVEIDNCHDYLLRQTKIIKPKIIITFGQEAKGIVSKIKSEDFYVFNLLHPAYFSYKNDVAAEKRQFDKIQQIKKEYIHAM